MYLLLHAGGQTINVLMEHAGDQTVTVGEYHYQIARMARRVRQQALRMWAPLMTDAILNERFYFEGIEGNRTPSPWGDTGSFSPAKGSMVSLGRWDEDSTAAIGLHELAHEMHMRSGGYEESDGVMREALALLAEREAGLVRTFDREPYYTAANLIGQLDELKAWKRQPFSKRWAELVSITSDVGLSDLVNYYLDRSERIGLEGWLKHFTPSVEIRDALMHRIAVASLRYSLSYRRAIIRNVVACPQSVGLEQIGALLDAVVALDKRYPQDDLTRIIDFCFSPVARPRRRLLAFG